MRKVIIVSAAPFEASPLLQAVEKHLSGLWQADYISCGIGALNAAKSANMLSQRVLNHHVIFIGTCGVFGTFDQPQVYLPQTIRWFPVCERRGLAYTVKGSAPEIIIPSSKRLLTIDGIRCICTCTPTISLAADSPPWSEGANDVVVENLELYSVANELITNASTVDIILASTNAVGPSSHEQWLTNHQPAAIFTAESIITALKRLG